MFSRMKKYSIKEYQNIAKSLIDRLELETDIVAMKFIKNKNEIPADFIRPVRDLNKKMTICKFLGHKGVMSAPLSKTRFIPDTCVVYGYPEQIVHVSHSYSFDGKYVPRAVLAGHAES